ncbi:MAG: DNA primase [Brevinema sp.]
MIPRDVVDSILRRISLVELMSRSVALKKTGSNYVGLCPFHNDRNKPSLSVSDEKGLYHCFSCGAGGNALTFLKEHERLDFIESMRVLAPMANIDIEPYLANDEELLPLRERLKTMHKLALDYFNARLYDAKDNLSRAAGMILRRRKIDRETAKRFGLGFGGSASDGLFRMLQGEGFKPDEIVQSGLCGRTEHGRWYDRFAKRITFPVWDENGTLIAFGGRAIEEQARAKYLNSPETMLFKKSTVLYGWNLAKEEAIERGQALIVEGYMDVIRLFQAGFAFAAAPMGTGLSEDRIAALKHKVDCLYFCFDGDAAGVKSAFRSSGLAAKVGAKAKVVLLPTEDDPDTYLLTNGPEAFADLIEKAIDSEEFIMKTALELLPDVQAFLQLVFEYAFSLEGGVSGVVLSVKTDTFLRKCAQESGLSLESVILDFDRFKQHASRMALTNEEAPRRRNAVDDDRVLASVLIVYPELADTLAELIAPDDFFDEECREVVRQIFLHPEKTAQDWLAYWAASPLVEEAAQWTQAPEFRFLKTHAVRLRIKSLTHNIELMMQSINDENSEEMLNAITELQKEKLSLKENFYNL